jgi:hypothetical protein
MRCSIWASLLGILLPQVDDAVVDIEKSYDKQEDEATLPLLPDQQS